MKIIFTAVSATVALGFLVCDALAQSQGPLTTVPWASRSRSKPNPAEQLNTQQTPDPGGQQLLLTPPAAKPVDGAPEPQKPKTADR
jgi:hypothetical protein